MPTIEGSFMDGALFADKSCQYTTPKELLKVLRGITTVQTLPASSLAIFIARAPLFAWTLCPT